MPSKTFLNLDSGKKSKLLEAAMHEFSNRGLYTEVSINQIIMNAGISRGSFYTYFTDKDDLFWLYFRFTEEKNICYYKRCL